MKLFIDTEWYDMIQDLPKDKQIEIMRAIFAFPNGNSDTHIWNKVIKPQLEQSAKAYKEKSARFAENRKKRWQRKSEQIYEQISDKKSEQIYEQISDKKSEQISNRYQYVNVNDNINNNSRNNTSSLSTTHVKQITPPTLEEVLEYAKTQNAVAGVGGFSCPQKIATEFWMHYDSQGWVKSNDSRTPVTNWKSLLRLWTLNPNKFSKVGVAVPDDYDLPL